MKSRQGLFATLVGVLCIVLIAGYGWAEIPRLLSSKPAQTAAAESRIPSQMPNVTVPDNAAVPDFSAMVARYGPAVVNVSTVGSIQVNDGDHSIPQMPGMSPDDPFRQFFRQFEIPNQSRAVPIQGLGSGFIISPDGYILTNAHVIDGAKNVTVKLTDRREFKAKVIGTDKLSDVAVVKIDANHLPTVTLGDSAKAKVGQWVVAIGSPYGFDNTVTAGIISATGRSLPGDSAVPFLQTDVPVNPGNSGGPLFDLRGNVIGINSQIYSRNGGFQGLSFAVPIDIAAHVKDQLIASGHASHGLLGVSVQGVSQPIATSFGLKSPDGAIVSSIQPDSPAAKAGLRPGDIILKLNGQAVSDSTDLAIGIAEMKPGTQATLEVWRNHTPMTLLATVGELNQKSVVAAAGNGGGHTSLGLQVRPLTPQEKQESGLDYGLLVDHASGPAANAGIKPGDVVLGVNGTPVRSITQLNAVLAKAGKHIALLVRREDATIFVPLNLG